MTIIRPLRLMSRARACAIAFSAIAGIYGQAAYAQSAGEPVTAAPALRLPTIMVNAAPLANSSVNLKLFPHQVQLFTARDLSREGPADLTQALDAQATGVNIVNSQANPDQPTILYHGFEISPIQGTPAGLSVYVNGARFNSPFGDLAIWSLLPDEAISAISLQDGNPAFGLNALGGAISVRLKDGFTAPGAQAELSGGSFGKVAGNLEYGQQAGNVAAYVDIGAQHEAGWRDEQSSEIENFYGDIGWRGPQAELHVNATLANSNLNGPGTVPVELLNADPASQFTGPNDIADKYAKLSASLTDRLTDNVSVQGVLYYDNLRENLTNGNGPNDLPCGPGPDQAYLCVGGPGGQVSTSRGGAAIPNFLPDQDAYGYFSYAQLNLNTSNTNGYGASAQVSDMQTVWGLANHLIAGLSYDGGFTNYDADGYVGGITADTRNYFTPAGLPSPGYLLDEPGTVPVGIVIRNAYEGAYVTDTLNLTTRLAVTAGGRFNIADIVLHDQDPPDPNAPGAGLSGRHYYTHLDPDVGATYSFDGGLTVFGNLSEENAAPTPAELSCASPEDSCSLANFQSGDPDLKQIVTRAAEIGLRGQTAAPGAAVFAYDLDYYDSHTSDDIEFLQSPFNPAGQGYFSNVGGVARSGLDADVKLTFPRWHIYAAYSRTEATYSNSFVEQSNNPQADENGNITVETGDHLPGIPRHIFKLGGDYQVTAAWAVGLSVTAQTSSFLYGDEANLTAPLGGYAVLDLTTHYQVTPALQVFGTIDNATDTKYYNYGTFSPVGADGGVYVAQAPDYSNPRSYSLAAPIGVFVGVKLRLGAETDRSGDDS
jgi:iron complex outermembrane receptor protein